MFRIAQLTDLHLARHDDTSIVQAERVLEAVVAEKPDLVVITGDVTEDGWQSVDALRWAKQWLHAFGITIRCLPGNHDVGNFAGASNGVITAAQVEAWNQLFATPWYEPADDVCVIGLNSMLIGSGLEAEGQQIAWLDDVLRDAHTSVAVFLHSPLMVDSLDEQTDDAMAYWLGPREARQALLQKLAKRKRVKLIASGHVHQARSLKVGTLTHAWGPPVSGVFVESPGLPNPPMPTHTGYLMHTFQDGAYRSLSVDAAPVVRQSQFTPWP